MQLAYSSSPAQLIITLPINNENIKIILAIDEKSNLIAINIAMQPSANPIKYPIVAFIIFVKYVNKGQFYLKTKLDQNLNYL